MPSDTPVASLSRNPGDLVPIRDHFITLVQDDPSELEFAEIVFGDYAHWKLIADTTWMADHLTEWRMVTDVKRKSTAFKSILKEAQTGRSAFSAAKYLIEEPWKDKRKAKVKEEVNKSTREAQASVAGDVARLKDYI